jgi:hypothetical protein
MNVFSFDSMNRSTVKNISIYVFAALFFGTILFVVLQRDKRIVNLWERNKTIADSIYTTADERTTARQFSDTILPALKQKGLIISYEKNEIHTIITVSGTMWKERSQFFKENFLTSVVTYNKAHGFSESVTLVDSSGHLFAKVIPPGRKELYE